VYRQAGKAGLKKKPVPGRPLKLGKKGRERLERILLRGAKKAGFATDLWTCPRVAEVITRRFAVEYHVDHVCRLLHALGWSPQKPQRRAVERDEEAIEGWVKQQWPRIKKKPRA
jgi:transposase